MPARKSDVRRSDISIARFVLADDETPGADTEPSASVEPTFAPPAASTPAPSATGTQTSPNDKKDKEKSGDKEKDAVAIEDLTLPKSIITRLAKGVLPPNTQIQANAILALSKSATVFINHLANSANEFTLSANKKTIMPADVFKALDEIEFGFMRERVEAEFAKFNEVQTSKRSTYRKKVAAMKKAANTGEGSSVMADASMVSAADETDASVLHGDREEDGPSQPRVSKKPRIDPSREDSRMELDNQDHDPSDAETTPEDPEEEEDDEEEVEEEEEEEEEAEDDNEGDDDERVARDEDEALDDEDSE